MTRDVYASPAGLPAFPPIFDFQNILGPLTFPP